MMTKEERDKALYLLNKSRQTVLEAVDGVTDSAREQFLIHIDNFPSGEHLIVIRAYDVAGNAGLAKVVVR